MESRKCTKCNINKKISDFYVDRTPITKIGCFSKCKTCCLKDQDNRKKNECDITIIEKICSICNIKKEIKNFYKSYRHKDGYFKWCSPCHENKVKNKGTTPIKRTKEYMIEYNKKRNEDVNYKITHLLRSNLKTRLTRIKNGEKLDHTLNYVGCSLDFFKLWMEFNFDNKMNWQNKGTYWHLDHIKPCASYDLSNQDDIYKCYNWTNLRPLYKKDNILKRDKLDYDIIINYKTKAEEFLKTLDYEIKDNVYKVNSTASCGEKPHSY